ncbi:hypothetical protein Taro_053884 [Colocasia esculenta]|uniref:Uncharacterized protein n=1 Tax=Colocasia esculenta TaxID=4460 RepID=A0A843XPF0_COLES|nr:hypothetical protein [Colocasia esculenta]
MVVPKKGTSTLLACPCRVLLGEHLALCFRWLAFQQGPSVSCRRVLPMFLGARAASVVVVFARAAVGFILSLHIHVGVSRRLREPTCGVAFTGAGLWSVEPVKGVLALLAVPLLWVGCRCVALEVEVHRLVALCSGAVFQNYWLLSWVVLAGQLVSCFRTVATFVVKVPPLVLF